MARQLRAQGHVVGLLALLDTYPAGYAKLLPDAAMVRSKFNRFSRRIKSHLANLRGLASREKLLYLLDKAKYGPRKIKGVLWRKIYRSYEDLGRHLPRALRDIKEFNSMAARDYLPQVYGGQVTLFWASGDLRASYDLVEGWRVLAAGGIEVQEIPGSHLNIIEEPYVKDLADKLSYCLEQAQTLCNGVLATPSAPRRESKRVDDFNACRL